MEYICVYASSSSALDKRYYAEAEKMAEALCENGYGLVFGGGTVGLMGTLARGMRQRGGKIIGVIPEKLNRKGIVYEHCDELFVTHTMRERKAKMEELSIGFLTMPGGFGTFEEVLEIITLKQLAYHNKPIALLNSSHYYDNLIAQFALCVDCGFAAPATLTYFKVAHTAEEAMTYFKNYKPSDIQEKWPGYGYEEEAGK